VLEHGKIVESGTHAELMRLRGHYAGMFRLQEVEEAGGEEPARAAVAS
jgi:ATP-binding cassette subfamily B protein